MPSIRLSISDFDDTLVDNTTNELRNQFMIHVTPTKRRQFLYLWVHFGGNFTRDEFKLLDEDIIDQLGYTKKQSALDVLLGSAYRDTFFEVRNRDVMPKYVWKPEAVHDMALLLERLQHSIDQEDVLVEEVFVDNAHQEDAATEEVPPCFAYITPYMQRNLRTLWHLFPGGIVRKTLTLSMRKKAVEALPNYCSFTSMENSVFSSRQEACFMRKHRGIFWTTAFTTYMRKVKKSCVKVAQTTVEVSSERQSMTWKQCLQVSQDLRLKKEKIEQDLARINEEIVAHDRVVAEIQNSIRAELGELMERHNYTSIDEILNLGGR